MLDRQAHAPAASARHLPALDRMPPGSPADQRASDDLCDTLRLLSEQLAPQRRVVHAGDVVYRAGEPFADMYIRTRASSRWSTSRSTAASRSSA